MKEKSEFKTSLNYKDRRMWTPETMRHPAKIHLGMLEAIILEYTQEGDTILDPMAGTGSTLILAMLHNRNAIGIEYEQKFCQISRANILLNRQPRIIPFGHAEIIQGDSRFLSNMFKNKADSIVFSPPYGISPRAGNKDKDAFFKGMEISQNRKYDKSRKMINMYYSDDPTNIGNLKYSDIDSIVFSPPYADSIENKRNLEQRLERLKESGHLDNKNWKNIKTPGRITQFSDIKYSEDIQNIGNLPFKEFDSIITSPPYEKSMSGETPFSGWTEEAKRKWWETYKRGGGGLSFERFIEFQCSQKYKYSQDKLNIGNLRSQTYFEAMQLVYRGCYAVLRSEGNMILITKNFIRKKKIIPLDMNTIKLCESIGFRLIKRHYRIITNPSFWRILYKQKYGLTIPYEDILVFQKNG